jgi:hypothetical protein
MPQSRDGVVSRIGRLADSRAIGLLTMKPDVMGSDKTHHAVIAALDIMVACQRTEMDMKGVRTGVGYQRERAAIIYSRSFS